jgi:hypothetical protein
MPVAADDQQPAPGPLQDPVYEPIGQGSTPPEGRQEGYQEGSRAVPPFGSTDVALALADWKGSVKAFPFWFSIAGAVFGTWALAAAFVALLVPSAQDASSPPVPLLVYSLASALMPATAALLAVHWGVQGQFQLYGRKGPQDGSAYLPVLLAAALRGLVLALLVLVVLLVQAGIAGFSGAVAAVSAGAVVLECFLFGAIGAGMSAWMRRPRPALAAGWLLALVLAAGSPAAAVAFLPLVRAEEPVTVALSVEWFPGGTRAAYRCSEIPAGVSEVYHTERVMWLPALSPSVLFLMLGADADRGGQVLGWVPAALQEAADGTEVPCVQGQSRSREEPGMPMALVGVFGQAAVAGAVLAGGHHAARRRRTRAG